MADFIIPKGEDYLFTIKVIEKDSFLPQDLTTMTSATIEFSDLETLATLFTATTTGVIDELNGLLGFELTAEQTELMRYDRGPKVDGYYLRPTYQALIKVAGTGFQDITTVVNKVYVTPVSE